MKKFLISGIVLMGFALVVPAHAQEKPQQVPALIHISSAISDGRYQPFQIVNIAREQGFRIIVFTEREVMRWEYGIWPLRNVIKKTVENNSVSVFGISNYLKSVRELQALFPDMILIPGLESTPFYYWSGSIFKGGITLHNAHKHLLVLGLSQPKDIKGLPITADRFSVLSRFGPVDIFRLWPLLLIISGVFLFLKLKNRRYKNTLERIDIRNKRIGAAVLAFIGILFLIDHFPFRGQLFDQYHGDQGVRPYQNLIDYVNAKKGLVFWAHPEAENISSADSVKIVTEKHAQDFYDSRDYTGFCIFYEGYDDIGRPGRLWDKVLLEYARGKRRKPVWAIGGLGFDFQPDLQQAVKDLRNIILLDAFTQEKVLEALARGSLYVIRGPRSDRFRLDDFYILDKPGGTRKTMGQTLETGSKRISVNLKGSFNADPQDNMLSIHLIKNGDIIQTFKQKGSFNIQYQDELEPAEKGCFYRLEIRSHGLHVVTNPIFCKS